LRKSCKGETFLQGSVSDCGRHNPGPCSQWLPRGTPGGSASFLEIVDPLSPSVRAQQLWAPSGDSNTMGWRALTLAPVLAGCRSFVMPTPTCSAAAAPCQCTHGPSLMITMRRSRWWRASWRWSRPLLKQSRESDDRRVLYDIIMSHIHFIVVALSRSLELAGAVGQWAPAPRHQLLQDGRTNRPCGIAATTRYRSRPTTKKLHLHAFSF
jgi:hypothetical protein